MYSKAVSSFTQRKRKRSVRLSALLVCVLFIITILLSSAYIFTHANHIHDHDGPGGACATCMHIQSVESLLETLFTAAIAATAAIGSIFGLLFAIKSAAKYFVCSTLVTQKVRLNN